MRAQQIRKDGRLLLGPRHQNRPAEQRPRLPPGQLAPGRDRGPDRHHDTGRVRDDGRRIGLDPVQRRGNRPLVGGGAVHRHSDGCVARSALLDKGRRDLADLVRDRRHHQGAGCLREGDPVDARAGRARGPQARADPAETERRAQRWRRQARTSERRCAHAGTTQVGQATPAEAAGPVRRRAQRDTRGVRRRGDGRLHPAGGEHSRRAREGDRKPRGDPRVGGDRGAGQDPGHHPEGNLGLGQRLRVGSTDPGEPWIRRVQPDDPFPRPGPRDDRGGCRVRVHDWFHRCGIADTQHLAGKLRDDLGSDIGINDDRIGGGQRLRGENGQQARIARAGSNESDWDQGLLRAAGGHDQKFPINVCAPADNISSARRSPSASGWSAGPVTTRRRTPFPSGDATTARSRMAPAAIAPSGVTATSARAPTGALQPASMAAR